MQSTQYNIAASLRRYLLLVPMVWLANFAVGDSSVNTVGLALPLTQVNGKIHAGPIEDDGQFDVPFGAATKIRGTVQAEQSKSWSGHRTRTTWQLGREHHFQRVFDSLDQYVEEQVKQQQAFFHCHSFGCGTSAYWVNNLLEMPSVTGLDDTQGIWVWYDAKSIHFLYVLQRGNREIYIFWQRIDGSPILRPFN